MSSKHISFLARSLLFLSFFMVIFMTYRFEVMGNASKIKEKDMTFSALTLPPASGKKPDSMVVLFHGYGDDSENFLILGALLGHMLPDTLFVAIDGPIVCKNISSGKQWLKTPKNKERQLLKEIKNLTQSLDQHLNNLLKIHDIPSEKMALVGFSQGARIALHIGLRRPACAGIVAFSGSYLNDPSAIGLSHPPILIIHGNEDQKAPISLARESYKRLDALKMPVTLIILPGVAHDIDPQGLAIAGEFLKECLSENKK